MSEKPVSISMMYVAPDPAGFARPIAERARALPKSLQKSMWVWLKKTDPSDPNDFLFDFGTNRHEWTSLRASLPAGCRLYAYIGSKGIVDHRQINRVLTTYAGWCDGIGFDYAHGWEDGGTQDTVRMVVDHACSSFPSVWLEANTMRPWSIPLAAMWGNMGVIAAPWLWRMADEKNGRYTLKQARDAGLMTAVVISKRPMIVGADGESEPMPDPEFAAWKVEQVRWAISNGANVILNPSRLSPDQLEQVSGMVQK